ncbi:FRG domain-containing protein [Brevibacillus nitrificans]|uniref:FRG domain-containing protein n=1 Tax=Brevibacillus nitrificans TaxID=651560 RepID=UPI0026109968|nr:FRG domain-containing protein [Brevibacillus nitrificans]
MVDVFSIQQLEEVVKDFKENSMRPLHDPSLAPITWYRGQSKSNYQLVPSLYRINLGNAENFIEFEQKAISQYIEKCRQLGISMEDSSWDIFYSMQHYGVKTRALDWSEKALIGLFFAFEKWNPEASDAALFLLDPIALNFIVTKRPELMVAKEDNDKYSYLKSLEAKNSGTLAVEPRFKDDVENTVNKRIIKQNGRFTLHETKWPLEAEIDIRLASDQVHILSNNIKSKNVLLKVNLKKQMYDEIKRYLLEKGVDYTFVYPDIEGVANLVNRGSLPNLDWYKYL